MDSIKYAYIGDCKAGWVSCFGHRWECGVEYSINVDAMVPGSVRRKRDGKMTPGVKVIDKLDGNPAFTKDTATIIFLATVREEKKARAKILAEKQLTFRPENKAKVDTILAEPAVLTLDGEPLKDVDLGPIEGLPLEKEPLRAKIANEPRLREPLNEEPSLDEILGYNS